jgi:hypothetical protein
MSVVRAKRAGLSLFNVIFVLKEKGEITKGFIDPLKVY